MLWYYIENLTKEQYAGSYRPTLTIFNSARDALNPHVNSEVLRTRLAVIDHFKSRYGREHTYWLHTVLRRMGGSLTRYKFNYLLKGFLAYGVYSSYTNYRFMDETTALKPSQRLGLQFPIVASSGIFAAACLIV